MAVGALGCYPQKFLSANAFGVMTVPEYVQWVKQNNPDLYKYRRLRFNTMIDVYYLDIFKNLILMGVSVPLAIENVKSLNIESYYRNKHVFDQILKVYNNTLKENKEEMEFRV
tara:strand:+ start:7773 stop:8111 length:339 start_codon:yes stop_codon:yes gene_type:complete